MKKMMADWVHIPGIHCGSVALRNVMAYHGVELSEEMCLGLGSGVGFFYMVADDISPTRMMFMRGPGMEHNFFSLLIEPTAWKQDDDPQTGLDTAKRCVDNNVPIIVQTDIFYLDYYDSSTHFPGHVVGIWGYDDEAGEAYLSDTGFEELQTVSYESLQNARFSSSPQFVLKDNWIDIDLKEPILPLEEAIPKAIRTNARLMLEGAKSARGLSGVKRIKMWAEDVSNWPDAQDWKWCARFGYQVITKRGVEGAGFRWMYRDFLREAEDICPELKPLYLSGLMDYVGTKWVEAAAALKEISEKDEPDAKLFKSASVIAHELWELERDFWNIIINNV